MQPIDNPFESNLRRMLDEILEVVETSTKTKVSEETREELFRILSRMNLSFNNEVEIW